MEESREGNDLTLVARKPFFDLPTACPICLPVYIYLKLARLPFTLEFNLTYPDSDQIPYVEYGPYVAYNNENDGVIDRLKQDGVVDLDSGFQAMPEWVSAKAMVSSWLADAIMYELWLASDASVSYKIYYSDLPWPIGKVLYMKQVYNVKQLLGISKDNAQWREEQIYKRAKMAYEALSTKLGEQNFLFEDGPSSLDALFLGHALFTLQALPETSTLRGYLLEHDNIVKYVEKLRTEFLEPGSSSSAQQPRSSSSPASRRGTSNWSSKPKTNTKAKKEKTEEEKKFKKRAKYFLAAQGIAVLLFLSIMGYSNAEVELDEDEGFGYE